VTRNERPVRWLQWFSIALLLIAGVVGLGLSLCGGFFLFASLAEPTNMGGIAGLAALCLAVGLVVLFVSVRQIRAISREPVDGVQNPLPGAVKRAAWFAVADFLVTGLWFFLPLIVSLLRRRRWSRWLICAVIGFKWLGALGLLYRPYGGWSSVMYFGLPIVALDVAVVVTLFSGAVSAWVNQDRQPGGGA
jgi:hypothetical protein